MRDTNHEVRALTYDGTSERIVHVEEGKVGRWAYAERGVLHIGCGIVLTEDSNLGSRVWAEKWVVIHHSDPDPAWGVEGRWFHTREEALAFANTKSAEVVKSALDRRREYELARIAFIAAAETINSYPLA